MIVIKTRLLEKHLWEAKTQLTNFAWVVSYGKTERQAKQNLRVILGVDETTKLLVYLQE